MEDKSVQVYHKILSRKYFGRNMCKRMKRKISRCKMVLENLSQTRFLTSQELVTYHWHRHRPIARDYNLQAPDTQVKKLLDLACFSYEEPLYWKSQTSQTLFLPGALEYLRTDEREALIRQVVLKEVSLQFHPIQPVCSLDLDQIAPIAIRLQVQKAQIKREEELLKGKNVSTGQKTFQIPLEPSAEQITLAAELIIRILLKNREIKKEDTTF